MLTPEQEEYRKQQRQEAGEQMDQMAENDALQEQANAGLAEKDVRNINFQVPGANNMGIAAPEDPNAGNKDINDLKKKLRAEYANDNEGYKQALKREGIDGEVHETNGVQSIMQAYYAGKIDKNTRDYMMADAIAKFARNTGRDIGNIGAQFTGGAINNNYETSEWDKRNSALAANETTARLAEQEGSEANLKRQSDNLDIAAKSLTNELANMKLEVPRLWDGLINNADAIENPILKAAVKGSAQTMLDKSVNGGEVTAPAMIAAIVANGGNELANEAQKAGKSVETYVADAIKGFVPSMAPSLNINAGTNIASIFGDNNDSSETGTPIDNPTANDQQEGLHLDTGVSNDIRDVYSKVTDPSVSPSDKGKIIRDLYQGAGTKADKFKLAFLVENNLIDPNESYNGASGKAIIERVDKWSQDSKFLDDYKHYTNGDLSNSEALQNMKKERAAQAEANRQAVRSNALKKAGLSQDATPEQIKAKIDELTKRPGSGSNPAIINQIKGLKSLL